MAEKTLKTRIALLYKTYAEWNAVKDTYKPLKGEVCICEVPQSAGVVAAEPALLVKVGDGVKSFGALPWASALAADVFAWAKKANLEFADLSTAFLNKLDERIAAKSENVEYQLVNVEGIFKLQKREIGATDWTDVSTIDVKALLDEKQDLITETNQLGSNLVSFDKGETTMSSTTVEGALREAWNAIGQGGTSAAVNVVKKEEAEEGYAATYEVTQGGEKVGVSINIPKDFLVKKAELKVVEEADKPYEGAAVGDKYIDFTVNAKDETETASHIYLPVKDLVDVYKGDEETITLGTDNTFSVKAVPMDKVTGLTDALSLKATQAALEAEITRAETAEAGKLDLLPGDEYTSGNAYNLPYYFYTVEGTDKIDVHTKTITLDGQKTQGDYSLEVKSATSENAGLMSAADKTKLDKAITEDDTLILNCNL